MVQLNNYFAEMGTLTTHDQVGIAYSYKHTELFNQSPTRHKPVYNSSCMGAEDLLADVGATKNNPVSEIST